VLGYQKPQIQAQIHLTQRVSSANVHAIDWKRVALPGAACGSSRPIHWQQAFLHSDVNLRWWNPVWVSSWEKPVFGDLDGDGRDEAALEVVCANGGGTADGQLAFSTVVFKAYGSSLRVIGIVTPRQPLTPNSDHVPLLGPVRLRRGRVIAPEVWYGPRDGTCCGSGRARTTWTYRLAALRPAKTQILQRPWTSRLYVADVLAEPGPELSGQEMPRVTLRPRLRIAIALSTFGQDKRNVQITMTIRERGKTVVHRQTVPRVSGITLDTTVVFGRLGAVQPGRATVTLDIEDPGAHPLRYPVVFTRH
jgi:hypothetical protein